ncbi:MAG: redox-regulated ATPase YchF [Deltaproteobacteria bacterium RBG_16_49_23]|nr:MAG: redox-regulated ATPase YchF [Deltaproteobacteria bacterium RBG_16_49_23]
MGFRCGIVGLPNAGKSTIFNALTAAGAEVASYPFCTIQPNVGIVPVPDKRLEDLARSIHPKKVTPTTLEFFDIAGLVKGASKGEGLGNQFLDHIRNVDAIAHAVRCFENRNVAHVFCSIDPVRDVEVVNTELILADLQTLEKRMAKVEKLHRVGAKEAALELEVYREAQRFLDRGEMAKRLNFTGEKKTVLADLHLLTAKPGFYVANADQGELKGEGVFLKAMMDWAEKEGKRVVVICGDLEAEIAELKEEEREEFRKELGLEGSSLERLIRVGYGILDLVTFYTTVSAELRAWTITQGTPAPKAAGKIHTDMERGFIRAEVISFSEFINCGSEHVAKEKGLLRSEGKEYLVQDGDIIHFRFNV